MKTIIAGSRNIHDYDLVATHIRLSNFTITEVFCGKAGGVDMLGCRWARNQKPEIPVRFFAAEWDKHGKVAGYIRNFEMAAYADQLILVWDGTSPGSANMLKRARGCGLRTYAWSPTRVERYLGNLPEELIKAQSSQPSSTPETGSSLAP
jgi:hypothetical protein